MAKSDEQVQLARDIEHYLAALSKLYRHDAATTKLEIVVNAHVRVQEGWTYDNWNGGTYGHAVFLSVPETVYLKIARSRAVYQNQIRDDLNKLHNLQNEHVAEVFIEMQRIEDADWRRESGVLLAGPRVVSSIATKRIWEDGYRVFFSHKTEVKAETGQLKAILRCFGATGFVAHEDIHPTKAWQEEIENALTTMDAFVAILTEKFHDSLWTDQEVGFAVARGVPIVALKMPLDPYGFIGKFQALKCDWKEAPIEIMKLLIKNSAMLDAFISALPRCGSFEEGNTLSRVFPEIDALTNDQADRILEAFNANYELKGSFGFNGRNSYTWGGGLQSLIKRATGRNVVRTADDLLTFDPSS